MTDDEIDDLAAALGASVVIPVGPKGRALSIAESMALRDWFDEHRDALQDEGVLP